MNAQVADLGVHRCGRAGWALAGGSVATVVGPVGDRELAEDHVAAVRVFGCTGRLPWRRSTGPPSPSPLVDDLAGELDRHHLRHATRGICCGDWIATPRPTRPARRRFLGRRIAASG